jgi:hypothetical protein
VALREPVEVATVEQRNRDAVALLQLLDLAALLPEQRDALHRALDVHILIREIEIGRDRFGHTAVRVSLEDERPRLVEPRDPVRVQHLCELSLDLMCEPHLVHFVHRAVDILDDTGQTRCQYADADDRAT